MFLSNMYSLFPFQETCCTRHTIATHHSRNSKNIANSSLSLHSISPSPWSLNDAHHVLAFSTSTYVMQPHFDLYIPNGLEKLHSHNILIPHPKCPSHAHPWTQSPSHSPQFQSAPQTTPSKTNSKPFPPQASQQSNSAFPTSSPSPKTSTRRKSKKMITKISVKQEMKSKPYARTTT